MSIRRSKPSDTKLAEKAEKLPLFEAAEQAGSPEAAETSQATASLQEEALPDAPTSQARPAIAVAPTPTEGLGWLRQTREEKAITLDRAASDLRIRVQYLEAIEQNHLSSLPAGVALGFVRSYARYLDLNEEEAVARCRQQGRGFQRVRLQMRQPIPDSSTPSAGLLTLAMMAALVVYAGWFFFASEDRALVSRPPELPAITPPQTAQTVATPESTSAQQQPFVTVPPVSTPPMGTSDTALFPLPAAQAPTEAPPMASMPGTPPAPAGMDEISPDTAPQTPDLDEDVNGRIAFFAVQKTWMRVSDAKGHVIEEVTLNDGDSYEAPSTAGIMMDIGNAGGVVMQVDGRDMPALGAAGVPVRGMSLDAVRAKVKSEIRAR